MSASEPKTFQFRGKDGVPLAGCAYEAPQETRCLVGVHGMAEHKGRYHDFGLCLSRSGVSFIMADLRGHGLSGGTRGHIWSFQDYLDDLDRLLKKLSKSRRGSRPFLFGHSLGGLIAVAYALNQPEAVSGLILSSPALGSVLPISPFEKILSILLDKIWPTLEYKNFVDPAALSRDPEVGRAYLNDPLVLTQVSVRFYRQTLARMEKAAERAAEIKLPLFMLLGSRDTIVSLEKAQYFYQRVSSSDRELKIYRGWLHELIQDPERDLVYDDILRWLHEQSC